MANRNKHPKEFTESEEVVEPEVIEEEVEEIGPALSAREQLEQKLGGGFVPAEPGQRQNGLYRTYSNGEECFSYILHDMSKVKRANSWEELTKVMGV